jgi:hypothetical protein
VGLLLTFFGILLLLLTLAGIVFGLFMAMEPKNRDQGRLFAIWWVPAVAAALGVLMKDVVTFTIGLLCFLVAGTVFTLTEKGLAEPKRRSGGGTQRGDGDSAETTKENRTGKGYGKAAS